MKILSVYYTHKRGGFCTRLYRLQRALAKRGHLITYCCLDNPPSGPVDGITWRRIPFPTKKRSGLFFWVAFTVWLPFYLWWVCRESRPDRLMIFGAYYGAAARLAAQWFRIPTILFLRALTTQTDSILAKPKLLRFFSFLWEKVGVGGAFKIVVLTNSMREDVRKLFNAERDKILVIPNDLPTQNSAVEKVNHYERGFPTKLVAAGVLDARKNVRLIIDALDYANKSLGEKCYELTVIGDGCERASLERHVVEQSVEGVSFTGWLSSIREELDRADVLVHAALHEGMPNVVLEALSAGLPVLLADTPELSEIAHDDADMLFSVSDPVDLGQKLIQLRSGADRVAQLELRSREVAKRFTFDWDEVASFAVIG